jgi:CRP-like cAMP-binding protein
MVDRDFFGFCTSLKPLELKALGELSHTQHLGAEETIYAAGDPSDTLYIINRGVVEAGRDSGRKTSEAYLSRGDIFGDVEVLTEQPRKYLVRTHEPVSLQCFHRKDFAELVRRVPSFFQYLSEHLAFRLAQARDLALARSHCRELSGSLSDFDLVTIYQTIVNSSQTGELRISNEKSDLISTFFFEKGQPRCGQFEHLTGEEAFWQLFLSDSLAYTFSFSACDRPVSDWIQSESITRNQWDLLITALQSRDELHQLKERMPDADATLCRQKSKFSWPPVAPPELQPNAEEIWSVAGRAPVTLAGLFRRCTFCELKIYQVVDQLLQSKHFEWSCREFAEEVA